MLRENGHSETNLSKSFILWFVWASVCAACVNVYHTVPTFIWIPVYAKHAVPVLAEGCICGCICAAGLNCLHMCKLCLQMYCRCAYIQLFKMLSVMCGMGKGDSFFGIHSHLFWTTILWDIFPNVSVHNWFLPCRDSMTNGNGGWPNNLFLKWQILNSIIAAHSKKPYYDAYDT